MSQNEQNEAKWGEHTQTRQYFNTNSVVEVASLLLHNHHPIKLRKYPVYE